MKWLKNQIEIDKPKKPKRITGTRFASILGLDRWNSEFKTWCAITKTYEEPFVDNKYTIAGKAIEPKIIEYLRKSYFMELKTPTDVYGKDYFKKTWGNFFPDEKIFGGMWDALLYEDDELSAVIEIKTTKRAEDWLNGAPEYYALQAALYAYLLEIDNVIMVVGFLEEKDYEDPESFIPSTENIFIDEFAITERFPQFQAHIERATEWWETYVEGGISPPFDETRDKDILADLRKNVVQADNDVGVLIKKGEKLKQKIEKVKDKIKDDEKELKEIQESLKDHFMTLFREGDTKVQMTGKTYNWILSKSTKDDIDKKALKKDGLLEKYTVTKESYRFTQNLIKED